MLALERLVEHAHVRTGERPLQRRAVDRDRAERGRQAGRARRGQAGKRHPVRWADEDHARDLVGEVRYAAEGGARDRSGIDVARVRRHDRLGRARVRPRPIKTSAHHLVERVRRCRIEDAGDGGAADRHGDKS